MDKVSVIIPSYNHAQYIREAIESVLAQTYKDIEIIVVDDGSSDNTKEILSPYIKDGKIRYIYQENRGLAAARNTGVKAAQGRYIKFLDSDDFLYSEQIEQQVGQIKTSDNFFSISDHCLLRPNGEIVKHKYYPADAERQLAYFLGDNPAPVHAYLVTKVLIDRAGGFDETLKACEDWDLWIRILQEGAIIKHLPYMGCCYRVSSTSMSANMESMFLQKCKVVEKVNGWLLKAENLSQYENKWYWFASALKANIKMFEESMARGMPFDNILMNALRMTDWLFHKQRNWCLKSLHKLIPIKKYIRVGYFLKIMFRRNYKFNLLNKDDLWKLGNISHRSKV